MKNTSFTTKSLLSQLNKLNENRSKLLCLRKNCGCYPSPVLVSWKPTYIEVIHPSWW